MTLEVLFGYMQDFMTKKQTIQLFEEKKVRAVWDDEQEKWYFSIVDVCGVLNDSKDALTARKYWNKLKQRLKEEGNETVTNCHQLKLRAADGKMRLTDVADTEQLFRLIQSIPSPKAEPFKQWMALVASQRMEGKVDCIKAYMAPAYGNADPVLVAGDSNGDVPMLTAFPDMKQGLIIDVGRSETSGIGQLASRARMEGNAGIYILQPSFEKYTE